MTDIAIPDTEVFQRFLAAAEEGDFETNADQVAIDIIARILNATDAADVLGGAGAVHARDYLDVPFTLTGVRFNKSSFDGAGPQFYALLEGASSDGEKLAITCGAKNVIAQAWKLHDLGALPIEVVLKQSPRPTSAGFYVLWLEAAPAGF
jgi:hypothetical protein